MRSSALLVSFSSCDSCDLNCSINPFGSAGEIWAGSKSASASDGSFLDGGAVDAERLDENASGAGTETSGVAVLLLVGLLPLADAVGPAAPKKISS